MSRLAETYIPGSGYDFKPLGIVHDGISEKCPALCLRTLAYTCDASARHVRCIARSNGIAGERLFADEIII